MTHDCNRVFCLTEEKYSVTSLVDEWYPVVQKETVARQENFKQVNRQGIMTALHSCSIRIVRNEPNVFS